jgi:serine/threonine-protein kinase
MVGTRVSHYEIRAKLGGGGMGVVYRAEDTKLHRTVALKFLPPDMTQDEEAKERFIQEAQAASALDHPNICTIHDIDETDDGRLFICMACYDGETVKQKISRGPLSLAEAVDIAIDAAKGLVRAHDQGIIHRDIKPGNIFVTRERRGKILDFGLVKLVGQTRLTQAGRVVGTAAYMSPEQAKGKAVDHRTDLWSLGATLYHMVSGRLPFEADHPQAALYAICHEESDSIETLREDVPKPLAAIIRRCMEKDRARRYASAEELVADLIGVRQSLGSRTRDFPTIATRAPVRPRWLRPRVVAPIAVLALAAALLLHPSGRGLIGRLFAGGATDSELVAGMTSTPDDRHVAVMPIESASAAEADVLLAEGLTEYLSFRLSQVEQADPSFWILPSNHVRLHDDPSPELVRAKSGVTLALVGRMENEGAVTRLHMDLVDARSLDVLRSWDSAARRSNVSALQHEVVLRLVEELGLEPEPTVLRGLIAGATTSPAACEAYLRGLGAYQVAMTDGTATTDDAIAFLREAIEEDSNYALAHAALGQVLWDECQTTNDPESRAEAIASLTRAIEIERGIAGPFVTLAAIHTADGNYDDAIDALTQALEADPANYPALADLATAYDAVGRTEDAERTYRRAIELRPGYWHPIASFAVFRRNHGDFEGAEDEIRKVLALTPENAWGYNALSVIYYDRDQPDEAIEYLERANEIEPTYTGYSNLGTIYFFEERYEDAARIYEVALALDPSHYHIWGNLGSSYLWVPGCEEKALAAYREAVRRAEEERKITPNNGDLLCFLAGYYAELGEPDEALELTERALELASDEPVVMFQAGHTYEVLGYREKALEWIGKALEHGYSPEQVETTPALADLRKDERYRRLIEGAGVTS